MSNVVHKSVQEKYRLEMRKSHIRIAARFIVVVAASLVLIFYFSQSPVELQSKVIEVKAFGVEKHVGIFTDSTFLLVTDSEGAVYTIDNVDHSILAKARKLSIEYNPDTSEIMKYSVAD